MSAEIAGWIGICDDCGHRTDATKGSREEAEAYAETCDCTSDTCEECP